VVEELLVLERVGVALAARAREPVWQAALAFGLGEVRRQPRLQRREDGQVDVGLDDERPEVSCPHGPHSPPVM
jgi:hypothetical protein